MNALIRPLTQADAAFVREILYHALFVPPGSPPYPRALLDEPNIRRYYAAFGAPDRRDGGVLALVDDQPVGAAWYRLWPPGEVGYGFVAADTPEITIALLPDFRGRGIGTRLLTALMAQARADGFAALSLSVTAINPARHLYERCGFVTVGVDGDSLTMRASLTAAPGSDD